MPRVVQIEANEVVLGMDDGTEESHDIREFNFDPRIDDDVQIYGGDIPTITRRREAPETVVVERTYMPAYAKPVNKVAYCLIAFFFGWCGANEFYAGHTGRGIASAIFFWTGIPEIVSLVRLIIALCKPEDDFGNIIM